MINILAIGDKTESWVSPGVERYQKRLKAPWDIKWYLLRHSLGDKLSARRDESTAILSKLDKLKSPYVVLLDERGQRLGSPALSQLLDRKLASSGEIVFIIGGAYGVTDHLRDRANLVLSFSDLVFPHQMMRLLLIEQIYRCQEISRGGPYHHQ